MPPFVEIKLLFANLPSFAAAGSLSIGYGHGRQQLARVCAAIGLWPVEKARP